MKIYMGFMIALAMAFLLLMHGIRGLRTEKVLKEGAVWQEVHIVWDWNKFVDWGRENRPFRKIEREQKEKMSEGTNTDTEDKKR